MMQLTEGDLAFERAWRQQEEDLWSELSSLGKKIESSQGDHEKNVAEFERIKSELINQFGADFNERVDGF